VEIAFLWGYAVDSTASLCNNGVDLRPFWDLLTIQAEIVLAPTLPQVIHDDPSDDKFLEAAVAGNASYIISGDKHLLKLSEFQGIQILKPKDFVQRHLKIRGNK
jgi:predicted nucleic acid-binding protein